MLPKEVVGASSLEVLKFRLDGGFEEPDLVKGVPQPRGVNLDDLQRSLPMQTIP